MANTSDALGLPAPQGARDQHSIMSPPTVERDGIRFLLPDWLLNKAVCRRFGLTADELSFTFVEPTPAMEKAAAKFAAGDQAKFGQRLVDSCLAMIGNKPVNMNQSMLDTWYRKIGVQGRQIVSQIFLEEFMVVAPDVIQAVKEAGEPVTC